MLKTPRCWPKRNANDKGTPTVTHITVGRVSLRLARQHAGWKKKYTRAAKKCTRAAAQAGKKRSWETGHRMHTKAFVPCCCFNAEKSEHLAILTRKSDITSPHVTMNGTQIPQVTSNKHLGVTFNNTLSWQQHVDKVYTSCARRIGMIRRLRRKLHPVVLKRIYLGAVLPKLEYACPVWCGGPTQKLIKMHANFCRRNGTALPSLQTRFDYHT